MWQKPMKREFLKSEVAAMSKFYDYDTFLKIAALEGYEELKDEILACGGPDAQCHLSCPAYKNREACVDVNS